MREGISRKRMASVGQITSGVFLLTYTAILVIVAFELVVWFWKLF